MNFFANLVTLVTKFWCFQTTKRQKIHEQIKLQLPSQSVVQLACQCVEAYRFGRASNISGYDKMTFFGYFGHFGLKIGPFYHWNLTKTPWDYKTRAQELTNGAIRMLLSFFVKIWESFKNRAGEGFLQHEIWG